MACFNRPSPSSRRFGCRLIAPRRLRGGLLCRSSGVPPRSEATPTPWIGHPLNPAPFELGLRRLGVGCWLRCSVRCWRCSCWLAVLALGSLLSWSYGKARPRANWLSDSLAAAGGAGGARALQWLAVLARRAARVRVGGRFCWARRPRGAPPAPRTSRSSARLIVDW